MFPLALELRVASAALAMHSRCQALKIESSGIEVDDPAMAPDFIKRRRTVGYFWTRVDDATCKSCASRHSSSTTSTACFATMRGPARRARVAQVSALTALCSTVCSQLEGGS